MAAIAARARLFGRSGLAAHTKAGGVGLFPGAIRNDQAQQLAHPRAGRRLEHAAPLRRRLVAELEHRRGTIETAVGDSGLGARDSERPAERGVGTEYVSKGYHRRLAEPEEKTHKYLTS